MISLDELLQSFSAMTQNELGQLPLIDADDYNEPKIYGHPVGDLPGLIYLGGFGLWLHNVNGLSPVYLSRTNEFVSPLSIQPSLFAKNVLQEKLFLDAIQPNLQEFCEAYIRNTCLYGSDYQEYVVGELNLVDMSQVPDSADIFNVLWQRISYRLDAFIKNDAHWAAHKPRPVVTLTASEKEIEGWKSSFAKVLLMDTLPHREREQALAKFWALVDHVHGTNNTEIPYILIKSFTKDSDSSLQEAVTRALYSMPFENVWDAIVSDTLRLEEEGQLASVLELWANDFSENQIEYLKMHFYAAPVNVQNAIFATAQKPENIRNPWAYKLLRLVK